MNYIKELLFLIGSKKRKLPIIFILFVCISFIDVAGIGLIGPYISLIIDDSSLEGLFLDMVVFLGLPIEKKDLLISIGLILVAIFFLKAISVILMNRVIIGFGAGLQLSLRSSLMESYQKMSYSIYLTRNTAEFIYAINVLVGLAQAVVVSILKLISDLVLVIAVVTLLAFQNILALSMFLILLGGLVFIYDRVFQERLKEYGQFTNNSFESLLKNLNEGLEGFKEIRILGKEKFFHRKVVSAAEGLARYQVKEAMISTSPRFLLEFIMVSFIVLLVVGTLMISGDLESIVVTLAMFSIAGLRLLPAASAMSSNLAMFRYNRDGISRLYRDFKLFENEHKDESQEVNNDLGAFQELNIKNIYFSYSNNEEYNLKNISINISSGQCIGFMGTSGAGKTTLIDLLLGVLRANKGEILFNGEEIDKCLKAWQSKVAYLPQEVFLVDGSVRDNVALGIQKELVENSRILESLEKSRMMEFVNNLPEGIDAPLGQGGSRISGGQRQRIALARSFYHEREVLIMDEATSALDDKTEKEIIDEIGFLKGKKTIIVIAHRLSTLKNCDYIYELDMGSIVRSGKPEDMITST